MMIKIGLLTCKVEGTYNTDPTPTPAANALAVVRDQVTFAVASKKVERWILDGGLGRVPGTLTQKTVTLTFQTELRGNRTDGSTADISKGAIANLLPIDPLLLSANLAATYTAESGLGARDGNVTYAPTIPSGVGTSCTLYFYDQLRKHIVTGCKVDFTIDWAAGEFGKINWTVKGIYNAIVDATFPTTQAFAGQIILPPTWVGSSSTFGAYAANARKAQFSLGNDIQMREDATAADGVAGFIIVGRASKWSLDPDGVAEATNPYWADWVSQTVKTITWPIGTQTGNKMTATLKGQYDEIAYSDHNKTIIQNLSGPCVQAALGDTLGSEIALKWF